MVYDVNIPAGYSTRQAASMLGISRHEITRLVRNGMLEAAKTDVGVYIIDPNSLHEFKGKERIKGRPWDASTAWAALLALEGLDSNDLSYHQKRRLNIALHTLSAEELVSKASKRALTKRFAISPSFVDDAQNGMIPSGVSDRRLDQLGLSIFSDELDGYVIVPLEDIVQEWHLMPDNNGKCTIRIPNDLPDILVKTKEMPLAVVAADLAGSVNARERRCGIDYLQRKLDEYRKN